LYDRGHSTFIDLLNYTHQQRSVDFGLDFVDDLNYEVAQADSCLLICFRVK